MTRLVVPLISGSLVSDSRLPVVRFIEPWDLPLSRETVVHPITLLHTSEDKGPFKRHTFNDVSPSRFPRLPLLLSPSPDLPRTLRSSTMTPSWYCVLAVN